MVVELIWEGDWSVRRVNSSLTRPYRAEMDSQFVLSNYVTIFLYRFRREDESRGDHQR